MVRVARPGWALVAVLAVAGTLPGTTGAPSADDSAEAAWRHLWTTTTGTTVPDDVAPLLADLAVRVGGDLPLRLTATEADDNRTVYGDIWSVCLSPSSGCDVADIYGTTSHNICERVPAHPDLWLYVTPPTVLTVRASGAAVGLWTAHTMNQAGPYDEGTISGLSCKLMDQPKVSVVYTDGVAMYRNA